MKPVKYRKKKTSLHTHTHKMNDVLGTKAASFCVHQMQKQKEEEERRRKSNKKKTGQTKKNTNSYYCAVLRRRKKDGMF